MQSIPETSQEPAFSLGGSFPPHDQPPLPPQQHAGRQAAHPAPSGFTAAGGLSQAMAALDGACMSEMPFSLMVEGGPAAEVGDVAEQLALAAKHEAAAADVAATLEALGCGRLQGGPRQGAAAGEHERELMPPPPPRRAAARQPPAGLSREQLAAAVLAATEVAHPSAAGWDASDTDEGMADSFGGPTTEAMPPEVPAGPPAEPPGGARRSCRLAAVVPGAPADSLAAGRSPAVQMRQVRHKDAVL